MPDSRMFNSGQQTKSRIENLPTEILLMIFNKVVECEFKAEDDHKLLYHEEIKEDSVKEVGNLRLICQKFRAVAVPLLGKVVSRIEWPLTVDYLPRLVHFLRMKGVAPYIKRLTISADRPCRAIHAEILKVAAGKEEPLKSTCIEIADNYLKFCDSTSIFSSTRSEGKILRGILDSLEDLRTLRLAENKNFFRTNWPGSKQRVEAEDWEPRNLQKWIQEIDPDRHKNRTIERANETYTAQLVFNWLSATRVLSKSFESLLCYRLQHTMDMHRLISDIKPPTYTYMYTGFRAAMSNIKIASLSFTGTFSIGSASNDAAEINGHTHLAHLLRLFPRLETLNLALWYSEHQGTHNCTSEVMQTTANLMTPSTLRHLRSVSLSANPSDTNALVAFIALLAPGLQNLHLELAPLQQGAWAAFFRDPRIRQHLHLHTLFLRGMLELGPVPDVDGNDFVDVYDVCLPWLGVPFEVAERVYVRGAFCGDYEMWCRGKQAPGRRDMVPLWVPVERGEYVIHESVMTRVV